MLKLPDHYFGRLGTPKPGAPFSLLDDYRFNIAKKQLGPGSVLDVGAYFGDFLKLARDQGREIGGTEINLERVALANKLLGEDIVKLDFKNGLLTRFDDQSFDNVVCTEVIEHIPNDKNAVRELCRVSRSKVVITVPYREHIRSDLCVHCGEYTPHSGHLHSYEKDDFETIIPTNWEIERKAPFGRRATAFLLRKIHIPRWHSILPAVMLLDKLPFSRNRWLLVVLKRKGS